MAKLKLTEKMTHEERLEAITKWEIDNEKERRDIITRHAKRIEKIHKQHINSINKLNKTVNKIREIIGQIRAIDEQIKNNKGGK
jgi:hypothetical protein